MYPTCGAGERVCVGTISAKLAGFNPGLYTSVEFQPSTISLPSWNSTHVLILGRCNFMTHLHARRRVPCPSWGPSVADWCSQPNDVLYMCAVCGVRCAVYGVRCAVCDVRCAVCDAGAVACVMCAVMCAV